MGDAVYQYQDGKLWCEGVPLKKIAAEVGTPVYVYSQKSITERAKAYLQGAGHAHYAVKANGNIHILRLLASLGMGADVTSGGELFLALEAGFPAESIIFSGVGKTAAEIRMALEAGIQALHAESAAEVEMIEAIAAEMGLQAPLGLRLNPNIDTETHPYISTGMSEHKFGIAVEKGLDLFRYAQQSAHLRPVGVAAHIGSQIRELAPFREAAELLVGIAEELKSSGIGLEYIDVGGGLGIDYQGIGDFGLGILDWVAAVSEPVTKAGYGLVMEPGRSVVGPGGVLLTEVIRTKRQGEKGFVIVDAGMSELLRPTLYQAYHAIRPVRQADDAVTSPVDVVGPICESGDFLAKGRDLPAVEAGDLLAVMDVGAYGFAMSSNYNGRVKAAEVLVDGDEFRVVRGRQTYKALLDGC